MKTNIKMFVALVLIATATCLSACSKDNDDNGNAVGSNGGNPSAQNENNSLTGTKWIAYQGNLVATLEFKTSSKGSYLCKEVSDDHNYSPKPIDYTYSGNNNVGNGEITLYLSSAGRSGSGIKESFRVYHDGQYLDYKVFTFQKQ